MLYADPSWLQSSSIAASEAKQHHSPRLNLTDLSLHSPSSIVGTPFDVSSPRYEYPFPTPDAQEYEPTLGAALLGNNSHPFVVAATQPPPLLSHPERAFVATHPRHFLRDPPVPPSLVAKKRKSTGNTIISPPLPRRRTRSSSIAAAGGDRDLQDARSAAEIVKGSSQRRFASEEPGKSTCGAESPASRHRSNSRDLKADPRCAEANLTAHSRSSQPSRR